MRWTLVILVLALHTKIIIREFKFVKFISKIFAGQFSFWTRPSFVVGLNFRVVRSASPLYCFQTNATDKLMLWHGWSLYEIDCRMQMHHALHGSAAAAAAAIALCPILSRLETASRRPRAPTPTPTPPPAVHTHRGHYSITRNCFDVGLIRPWERCPIDRKSAVAPAVPRPGSVMAMYTGR